MNYKKDITSAFLDEKLILKYRYESSRSLFIYWSLIFFLNYFFVWAKFFDDIFLKSLTYSYFVFLIVTFFYSYFFLKYTFEIKWILNIILIIIFLLLFLIFSIPFAWIKLPF